MTSDPQPIKGRIVKGVGGLYTVAADEGVYTCTVRGVFRKRGFTPAVGDFVFVEPGNPEKRTGTITRFAARRSELIRPRVANVDQVVIVFGALSIDTDRLDRFILLAEERALDILICINKADLTDSANYAPVVQLYSDIGYRVRTVSAKTLEGADALRHELNGRVSVLAGPSGEGKSSLVNALFATEKMQTGELSRKLSRGKHTTRHAELLELTPDTFIVDTPGFTSLSIEHIPPERLDRLFREFLPLGECRFNDCQHITEPDCTVRARLGVTISPERYARYVALRNELSKK